MKQISTKRLNWLIGLIPYLIPLVFAIPLSSDVSYADMAYENKKLTGSAISPQVSAAEQGVDFSQLYNRVYQIQVIETETQNKSTLGSGFQISDDGLVITNYHVISNLIFEPDHHRVMFVDYGGLEGELELLNFDVVNDLALLRLVEHPERHKKLTLAEKLPRLGASIYSLGNPRDVGMLMVTGAYNGLAENNYSERILYSGSLNPGMSGGPAVNSAGEVVGVNVSTAGSQLSFLVPVTKVHELVKRTSKPLASENYLTLVSEQLISFQKGYFLELLQGKWPEEKLGNKALVAGELGLDTNCWGNSNEDDDDANYLQLTLSCNNSNHIYVKHGLNTGVLHYSYVYNGTEKLSSTRFHAVISDASFNADNRVPSDEVTQYQCEQNYLATSSSARYAQTGFCTRAYVQLEGLYDILFYQLNAADKESLSIHFTLAGVTKDIATSFTERFMESAQWK